VRCAVGELATRSGRHRAERSGTRRADSGSRGGDGTPGWYLLDSSPALTAEDISSAHSTLDEFNMPAVNFTLTDDGVRKIQAVTTANVGRCLAILVGSHVVSAPTIDAPIRQREGRITGRFTRQEAADLALLMRAGALPLELHLVDERALPAVPGPAAARTAALASAVVFTIATVVLLGAAFLRRKSGQ